MSFHTRTRLAVTAIITSTVVTSAAVTAAIVAPVAGTIAPAAAAQRPGGTAAPQDGFIRPPCAVARPRTEQCFLEYRSQTAVNRAISAGQTGRAASPRGWSPRAIRSAYNLPARHHSSQTVAVSIAFNTPRLAYFLRVYRQHYGLPRCTVASGCFRKVNQRGKASPLPPSGVNTGWDLEATLDVSMISVACPHCHIVVVEASSPGVGSLAKTEDTAARLGAQVISNSYGQRENGFALALANAYHQPGHTIVVSAGDLGFTAANFPADLATVTSVGGTALTRAANKRGWREQVWNGLGGAGGSGCSAYVSKPSWQQGSDCSMRTVADVSAIATNVPVYNPTYGGWVTVAGTSIAAPLIAGIYGLAGNGDRVGPGRLYRHASSFFDITKGNNSLFEPAAEACGDDYLCVAKKGYDAPTGLGTPDGTGAF
jgi:subtilase family serine protease